MRLTGAEIIVEYLMKEGVPYLVGIPGHANVAPGRPRRPDPAVPGDTWPVPHHRWVDRMHGLTLEGTNRTTTTDPQDTCRAPATLRQKDSGKRP
jgi:hypothetical protein